MTNINTIISAATLSVAILAGQTAASRADDVTGIQSFRPLQGLILNAGQKRGVGYFSNDAGNCKLVLTFAEKSNEDQSQTFTASRHEFAVRPGEFTRYTSEGQAFEFGCINNAELMTMKTLKTLASAQSE